jgi:hypothetical protein
MESITHRRIGGVGIPLWGWDSVHIDGWIHHNNFHDSHPKADPGTYSSGDNDIIEFGDAVAIPASVISVKVSGRVPAARFSIYRTGWITHGADLT